MSSNQLKLIVGGVVLLFLLIFTFTMFDVVTVRGHEVGVKETFSSGIIETPLTPKTYVCWPWERVKVYHTGVNVFECKDNSTKKGAQESFKVQSKDSQDMHLSLLVQWRIDPLHVINIHRNGGMEYIEDNILKPTVLRTVKDEATTREAIEAYSGDGLVKLQQDIEKKLNEPTGELAKRGLIVDQFVIEHIRLDEEYVGEIKARQVAQMKEMRATQEEKAAQAEALKAKAVAQAELNKAVVGAERDKQVAVLKAEGENEKVILQAQAENEKVILAAKAEKEKMVLEAEAEKESGELRAAAILAVGKANAETEKLKFSAYSAPGAETYAKIEIAKSMGTAFGNIKGYLPENMQIFTLGENFLKAVENVAAPKK